MEDRLEAIEVLLRAKKRIEEVAEELRRAIELLQDTSISGPSQKDLQVVEQLEDIVRGSRKSG